MRVSVELPDPKTNGLDAALAKQFADIQRSLLRWVESKDSSAHTLHRTFLEALGDQQTTLVKAMERLMGMMGQLQAPASRAEAMVEAVTGLKRTLSALPGDLKDALDRQYQAVQSTVMTHSHVPRVKVTMPTGLMDRIDSLETALLHGLRRSRSRTFGSNF